MRAATRLFELLSASPERVVGVKVAGLTTIRLLDSLGDALLYEAEEDAGQKRHVYICRDLDARSALAAKVKGFETTEEVELELDAFSARIPIIIAKHRIVLGQSAREHLSDIHRCANLAPKYRLLRVLGSGFKAVTYEARVKDGLGPSYALKLAVAEDYGTRPAEREINILNALAQDDPDHFPPVYGLFDTSATIDGLQLPLIGFVQQYVKGATLEEFIRKTPDRVTPGFLEQYTLEMLSAIKQLQTHGIMHDDLHEGNVMVRVTDTGLKVTLIDFGSAKPLEQSVKLRDDLANFSNHLAHLINLIRSRDEAYTTTNEQILRSCESLHVTVSDEDPLRRPTDAGKLLASFKAYRPIGGERQKLATPFDFPNAEEVLDNSLLYKLAERSFPWKDKINASSHVLVVGPRGCGKTTVFRSLSFSCRADAGQLQAALAEHYIGLYISCSREFRQRFSAVESENLRSRHASIRHYFNLLVAREFTQVLIHLAKHGELSGVETKAFIEHCRAQLGVDGDFIGGHAQQLAALANSIVLEVSRIRDCIVHDGECGRLSNQDFTATLSDFARSEVAAFSGKVLHLYVDDYTDMKVSPEAQRALNHILFVPNSSYKCKVSSEVFGVILDETFGNFLDQDRDYKQWNLGTQYLKLPTKAQKTFLAGIVNTRLELCGYSGKITDVIGPSSYHGGKLSLALKHEHDEAQRIRKGADKLKGKTLDNEVEQTLAHDKSKAYYHGWDTICELCSGDVSTILEILRRMYDEAGIGESTKTPIPASVQHEIIQSYSLQFLNLVRGYAGYGERLFGIIEAFGSYAGKMLREHPLMEVEPNRLEPYRVLRLELDLSSTRVRRGPGLVPPPVAPQEYSPPELWRLLQRHCLFISAGSGRSRRNTVADKVWLRRIFCPAFRLSLASREPLALTPENWALLCADPRGYLERRAFEQLRPYSDNQDRLTLDD